MTVVAERAFTSDDLAALLERFPLERAGTRPSLEITEFQVQLLLSRIAALTDALRDAESDETTRLAHHVLLSDLALVAGQFRGRANGLRASLVETLASLRDTIAHCEAPAPDRVLRSQPLSFEHQPGSE